MGNEVCVTSTKSLRSRVKLKFHARFWRPTGLVTVSLSLIGDTQYKGLLSFLGGCPPVFCCGGALSKLGNILRTWLSRSLLVRSRNGRVNYPSFWAWRCTIWGWWLCGVRPTVKIHAFGLRDPIPQNNQNHSAIMQRPKVSEFLASRIIFTAISRFMEYGCKGLSTILVSAWD